MEDDQRLVQVREAFRAALGAGDPAAITTTTRVLADLLEEQERWDDSQEVCRTATLALRRIELGPALTSQDPVARSRAWWTLGWELEHQHHDDAGAAGAYRNAVAADGEPDVVLAASMNLGALLIDAGDRAGARLALGQALAIAESYPADDPLADVAPVVAMKLADLDR